MSRLKRVCAWCGLVMDEGSIGAQTTHGICPECQTLQMAQANKFWNSKIGTVTRQTAEKESTPKYPR